MLPLLLSANSQNIARMEVNFETILKQPRVQLAIKEAKKRLPLDKTLTQIFDKIMGLKYLSMQLYMIGFIGEIKGIKIDDLIPKHIKSVKIKGGQKFMLEKDVVLYQYDKQIQFGMPSSFQDNKPIPVKDHPVLKKMMAFKNKPVWGIYVHLPEQARAFIKQASMDQVPPLIAQAAQEFRGITIRGGKIENKDRFELTFYLNAKIAQELVPFLKPLHKQSFPFLEQAVKQQYNQIPAEYQNQVPLKTILKQYKDTLFFVKDDKLIIQMEMLPELSFTIFTGMVAAIAIPAYQGYIIKSKISMLKQNMMAAKHFVQQGFLLNKKQNIIEILNNGNKTAPFNQMGSAFTLLKPIPRSGQIQISGNGSCKLPDLSTCKSGDTITITPGPSRKLPSGTVWPKAITVTKE